MREYHIDRMQLDASGATMRGDGSLVVPAALTRSGVLTYHDRSGKPRRRLRHADDVLAPERVAAMGGVPVTLDHPPEMVTPDNASRYAVGTVDLSTWRDGDRAFGTLVIHDKRAIDAVVKGTHREVSLGYWADIVQESGSYNGEHYDDRQTGQAWNHAALVEQGRNGPTVRVMLDAQCNVDTVESDGQPTAWMEATPMAADETIIADAGKGWAVLTLDGADIKIQSQTAKAIADALRSRDDRIAELTAERDAAGAKAEAADKAVNDAKAEFDRKVEEATKEADAKAEHRARIRAAHLRHTGKEAAADADNVAMQRAVIDALSPGHNLDNRKDVEIAAIYGYVCEQADKAKAADASLRTALDSIPGDTKTDTLAAATRGLIDAASKR